MTVSKEDEHACWSIEEQSGPFVHNCSTSCTLGFELHFGRLGFFAHSNLLGLGGTYLEISHPLHN
jgi:hypothetical protein